jgi:allantoinase
MTEQSQHQPLVMGIALHPYLVGQPHRLRQLRRALKHICAAGTAWWTTPGAIYDHVQTLP